MKKTTTILLILLLGGLCKPAHSAQTVLSSRVIDSIITASPDAYIPVVILLEDRVDMEALDQQLYAENATPEQRSREVIAALKTKAVQTQAPLLNYLRLSPEVQPGSLHPLWVTNAICVSVRPVLLGYLARRMDIEFIDLDAELILEKGISLPPQEKTAAAGIGTKEEGLEVICADEYWKRGYTGYGTTVAGFDSGVNGHHPALRDQWKGISVPSGEAWYVGQNGPGFPEDCDVDFHGTHTMGIMCGLDRTACDTIGVAFNAQWIASPPFCGGGPVLSRVLAAFEWAMDPDGDSTTADMPDVICNAWYDPLTINECSGIYSTTFTSVEAAGIAIVFSAGNHNQVANPASTISAPKNINTTPTNVFCVGNIDGGSPTFNLQPNSGQGPSTCGGAGRRLIKPEVAAPGVAVRSSVGAFGYAPKIGTSFAAPHVAGAIALLKEAFHTLTGTQLKEALYWSATDLPPVGEDNKTGMGLINVCAAHDTLVALGYSPVIYSNDAMAHSVEGLPENTCTTIPPVGINLRNTGRDTLFSATVVVTFSGSPSDTLYWTGSLAPNQQETLHLTPRVFTYGDYTLEVEVSQPNGQADDRPDNDRLVHPFTIEEAPLVFGDTLVCGGSVNLVGASPLSGTPAWYVVPTFGTPLVTGVTYSTPYISQTTAWYYDILKTTSLGPVDNNLGSGGVVGFSSPYLIFDVFHPFVLKSVTAYADQNTSTIIELRDASGQVREQKMVNVVPGVNRINLDFKVPPGADFQLGVGGPANLYRNLEGATFPYEVPGVLTLKGSSSPDAETYYFFYDWEVEYGSFCGRTRAEVFVKGAISAFFSPSASSANPGEPITFFGGNATQWYWDFGDGTRDSSQVPVHSWSTDGLYEVELIMCNAQGCCDTTSRTITIGTVDRDPDLPSEEVNIYPNPAAGSFQLSFQQSKSESAVVSLVNVWGQEVFRKSIGPAKEVDLQINIARFPAGLYTVRITRGKGQITRKIRID